MIFSFILDIQVSLQINFWQLGQTMWFLKTSDSSIHKSESICDLLKQNISIDGHIVTKVDDEDLF